MFSLQQSAREVETQVRGILEKDGNGTLRALGMGKLLPALQFAGEDIAEFGSSDPFNRIRMVNDGDDCVVRDRDSGGNEPLIRHSFPFSSIERARDDDAPGCVGKKPVDRLLRGAEVIRYHRPVPGVDCHELPDLPLHGRRNRLRNKNVQGPFGGGFRFLRYAAAGKNYRKQDPGSHGGHSSSLNKKGTREYRMPDETT